MKIKRKKIHRPKHSFISNVWYDLSKAFKKLSLFILKIIIMVVLVVSFTLGGLVIGSMAAYINTAPLITDDQLVIEDLTTFIYDKDDNVITQLQGSQNMNRIIVSSDQIPQNLKDAFVAIEDERFYEHNGIDYRRIASAIVGLIIPGIPSHGGSTITQQLIKNITGDDDVSLQRKIQEQWRALQLERKLDKWQILELYMNIIYMGEGAYGVQAASLVYFDKDVWDLSLAECASLAGITNSPGLFDPFYETSRERNLTRQQFILDKMLEHEYITRDEYDEATAQTLKFNLDYHEKRKNKPISYQSYFVDQVILDVKKDLMEQYDFTESHALELIYNKGLVIHTTQDTKIQNAMTEIFTDPDNFTVDSDIHSQAAMVVMDPSNGNVVSLYGGFGEKEGNTFNRATQMSRQAGSCFKPIAAYGPAIDKQVISAGTIIDDVPSYLDPHNPDDIYPRNYDSDGYEGLTTIRKAIQSSINTVAAKVWLKIPDISLDYLDRVKLNRDDERYISLALGGLYEGVNPLQMAAAYQPFVNKGLYYEPRTYTKVYDSEGNLLLNNFSEDTIVYEDERTCYIMTDMMKDVVNKGTAYPYGIIENKIGDIIPTAGKTGTTSDYYDKWFVGYSPYYVGATWYGYDMNTKLVREEYRMAQILWQKVMMAAHEDLDTVDFERPSGISEVNIDRYSGMLPSELSYKDPRGSSIYKELFIPGTEPYQVDNIHKEVTVCKASYDDHERAYLALPWCPETHTVTKVLLDKPIKFKPHENEDGTIAEKVQYPDDYRLEIPTDYCYYHQMPEDYDGIIPWQYREYLAQKELEENEESSEDLLKEETPSQ